ncbi:MAG: hypothetical protein M9921_00845 [Fimbriimonadaceae bacterium]|nr:hypothetical protein [Chthonomonadaceae bacterium]MCO5295382.1 hypothetical protein [Fimbriimonadaceae bacterium]
MKQTTLAIVLAALASAPASAQVFGGNQMAKALPFRVTLGYGRTETFRNNASQRVHLEGPEIGLEIPLARPAPGAPVIMLMPSVLLGGQLTHGGDTDGYVYRGQIGVNAPIGAKGFYTRFAIGYSASQARNNEFEDQSGFTQRYTVGYGLNTYGAADKASLEVSYHTGSDGALRGWTFGANIRF